MSSFSVTGEGVFNIVDFNRLRLTLNPSATLRRFLAKGRRLAGVITGGSSTEISCGLTNALS
ncbi:MAG: hypothetical protein PHG00_03730 [Methylococcales bacterium]|nr:hypothetical protein [Methylococcales bacterium]